MEQGLYITNSILVNASLEKVWDVLTNPEMTKKYMFGCETISDWKPGSKLLWKMNYNGQELIAVTGIIKDIQPGNLLIYTTFDPNSGMEDIPENHLTVTYSLENKNGNTLLTVTQGDYSKVADGEKRFRDSNPDGEGWNPILVQIQKLAEE